MYNRPSDLNVRGPRVDAGSEASALRLGKTHPLGVV